jgi:DNA-binding NarL/FixJ family response regulator
MSDRPLRLLLIDQDPIFRLGLRVALETVPDILVVSEAETDTAALQILAELSQNDPYQINLVLLELGNGRSTSSYQQGLQLCRHLRTQYPNLPVLLLSSIQDPGWLLAAKAAGVNGYCPKGTPVSELVTAMQTVVTGGSYWDGEMTRWGDRGKNTPHNPITPTPYQRSYSPLPFSRLRNRLRLSGMDYINANLAKVTSQLLVPGLPILDRAILAGQRRELIAARWLVNHLLASHDERQQDSVKERSPQVPDDSYFMSDQFPPSASSSVNRSSSQSTPPKTQNSPALLSPRSLQASLFASCITKLQFPLQNLTSVALEIDILRADKKRELLYIILQKLADVLDEIRSSHVEIIQLNELKNLALLDIWKESITEFFGKFSRIKIDNNYIEIVNLLLQSSVLIQTEILNKIPLVIELFSYLLFQTDLHIDNNSYPPGSPEATEQAEMILENLLIQVANGVLQPMLNSFADIEDLKESFYNRKLISTREIERFRNDLTWRYRIRNYVSEPRAIFESRYELFVIAPRGIAVISVYAPRTKELAILSGIPLFVTLGLEFGDAIIPRLKTLLSFLGSGVVFVLTKVIGRGIGLIARGIIQGIGNVSLPERKNKDF